MNTLTTSSKPYQFPWLIGINAVAVVVFACSPVAHEYPLALVSILAFVFVQALFPACRIFTPVPLCPANLAQFFFWVQLVLIPILIGFYGPSQGTLPNLPSHKSLDIAILLHVAAYVSYCAAFQYFSRNNGAPGVTNERETATSAMDSQTTTYLILFFTGLGVIGFFLAYGGIGGYLEFISSPILHRQIEPGSGGLGDAAAVFLRPFLGFAMVLAWSWWLRGKDRQQSGFVIFGITAGLMVFLLFANFSYNRGSMVAPIMAVVAAYSVHVRRVTFSGLALAGTVALFAAVSFGWYRSTNLQVTELTATDINATWSESRMVEFVQIYASGPQMTAFLLERLEVDGGFYAGRTLAPSLIYPVPILGKPFREMSGVAIYNNMIYGDPDVVDQIISYDAELYMNFHIPGVVLGYALLGWLVTCFQRRFLQANRPIESYAWLQLGLWSIYPGSLPVASQMYIYFLWPIYTYFFITILWASPLPVRFERLKTQPPGDLGP